MKKLVKKREKSENKKIEKLNKSKQLNYTCEIIASHINTNKDFNISKHNQLKTIKHQDNL
jgi:hypothetical protein